MNNFKPNFLSVTLAEGLKWRGSSEWRFELKYDGVWSEREIRGSILTGEQMRNGDFFAFDVPVFQGSDIRQEPLRERLKLLNEFPDVKKVECGSGGEFLEYVIHNLKGEGIVAKRLSARFGQDWIKCKKTETYDAVVYEKHSSKSSVRLIQFSAGEVVDCGWMPVFSKYDSLTVGDVVEIECHSRHGSLKFREARLSEKGIRQDKSAGECVV